MQLDDAVAKYVENVGNVEAIELGRIDQLIYNRKSENKWIKKA